MPAPITPTRLTPSPGIPFPLPSREMLVASAHQTDGPAVAADPGIGYRVDDLIAQVKRILGTDKIWNVLLVGAGNLGRALMAYKGFNAKGFRLTNVFDASPQLVGKKMGSFTVHPMTELQSTIQKNQIRLAMLAVPADNAQDVVDQLVGAGIRGILNFAPTSVNVPPNIALNAVDLSVQLGKVLIEARRELRGAYHQWLRERLHLDPSTALNYIAMHFEPGSAKAPPPMASARGPSATRPKANPARCSSRRASRRCVACIRTWSSSRASRPMRA